MDMNHVVCVKWGNKYISKYANVLFRMCQRNITVPWDFHCITDDVKGLDPHIKTIKLPNIEPAIKLDPTTKPIGSSIVSSIKKLTLLLFELF